MSQKQFQKQLKKVRNRRSRKEEMLEDSVGRKRSFKEESVLEERVGRK